MRLLTVAGRFDPVASEERRFRPPAILIRDALKLGCCPLTGHARQARGSKEPPGHQHLLPRPMRITSFPEHVDTRTFPITCRHCRPVLPWRRRNALRSPSATRIALLTRTWVNPPDSHKSYTVAVLTRSRAATSRTVRYGPIATRSDDRVAWTTIGPKDRLFGAFPSEARLRSPFATRSISNDLHQTDLILHRDRTFESTTCRDQA